MSDDNNVVYLHSKLEFKKDPVPTVCEEAGQILKDVDILGAAEDGTIKMMTTQPDPAEIIYYLENAKYCLLAGGMDDEA